MSRLHIAVFSAVERPAQHVKSGILRHNNQIKQLIYVDLIGLNYVLVVAVFCQTNLRTGLPLSLFLYV